MKNPWRWLVWAGILVLASGIDVRCAPVEEIKKWPLSWELGDYHFPDPDWSAILDAKIKAGLPLPEQVDLYGPPADRANPEEHLQFWRSSKDWARNHGLAPSPVAQAKILQELPHEPGAIVEVLEILPTNEPVVKAISILVGKLPTVGEHDKASADDVKAWLFLHGGIFRDDVLESARHTDAYSPRDTGTDPPSLLALIRREPAEAVRILEEFAGSRDPARMVLGVRFLLGMTKPEEKPRWRSILIDAAANGKFDKEVRKIAVKALVAADWPERDAWILSRLESADCEADDFSDIMEQNAPRWLPVLIKMTRGNKGPARDHAALLLADVDHRSPVAVEAFRALLPWLKDPEWAKDAGWGRANLIQSLSYMDFPECTDGLIEVLRGNSDSKLLGAASLALGHYHAKQAVPAMKQALLRAEGFYPRNDIIRSIRRLDGFSNEEIAAALEAYFIELPTEELRDEMRREQIHDAKPVIIIGSTYAEKPSKDPHLLEMLSVRAKKVAARKPQLATGLRNVLVTADPAKAASCVAECLADGTITSIQLGAALFHCDEPEWKASAFDKLSKKPGESGGLAAVLSRKREAMDRQLHSGDPMAQLAVLSAARPRDVLDFKHVAKLLESKDDFVPTVAEDYLSGRGEAEARRLLYDWENRDASGPPMPLIPPHDTYGGSEDLVQVLLERNVIKDRPKEIIGLGREANGGCRAHWQVMVFQDHALAVRDFRHQRIGVSRMPDEPLARIQQYITTYQVDDLPRLEQPSYLCGESYHYFHATSKGVDGLFMDNPPTSRIEKWPSLVPGDDEYQSDGITIYGQLVNVIVKSFEPLDLKLSYGKNAEILIPRETAYVETVWKKGDDLRVLIGRRQESRRWMAVDPNTGELKGPAEEPAARAGFGTGADSVHGILAEKVEKILKIEELRLSPWKDEAEGMAYVAVNGDLLRVAMPSSAKEE